MYYKFCSLNPVNFSYFLIFQNVLLRKSTSVHNIHARLFRFQITNINKKFYLQEYTRLFYFNACNVKPTEHPGNSYPGIE